MGIDPIGYKPWSGERTSSFQRLYVMAYTFFRQKLKSKWVLILLILGLLGVFVFPIILYSLMPHESLEAATMANQMGNEGFFVFTLLLAAIICSDSISEDLRSSSFVLYFSRAMRPGNYLSGKLGGIVMVLGIFTFLPPIIMAIALLGTQSGSSYGPGLGVLGYTIISSIVATVFYVPLAMLISSLTTRKSYASIGTFMVLFVMTIIGEIFSQFDSNWKLINPGNVYGYFNDWLFGLGIPTNIDGGLAIVMFCGFMIVPGALLYLRIHNRAVGK